MLASRQALQHSKQGNTFDVRTRSCSFKEKGMGPNFFWWRFYSRMTMRHLLNQQWNLARKGKITQKQAIADDVLPEKTTLM